VYTLVYFYGGFYRDERLIVQGKAICLESEALEVLVKSKLIRCQILNSWVISWSGGLNGVVQGESVVVGVHHVEQSSSAERTNRSVLINNSPCVVGNVSASVVCVISHGLPGNVESSNGGERSVRLFPLSQEIVNGVEARILLPLDLEVVAVRLSSQSSSHVLRQIVCGGSCRERETNRGGVVAWPQSILDGSLWKRSRTELVGRNGIVWHGELRANRVVCEFHSKDCSVCGERGSEPSSAL